MAASDGASVSENHHPDDLVGQRLGGYRLVRVLGRRGISTVYLADDVVLGRHVAVKVLPGWVVGADRQRLEQFLQEARAAAQLQHPHVVTVYHVGQQADHYFVAMEYMGGGSLRHLLDRCDRLAPAMAASIIRQATRGLAAAHRAGIIHRDVKPSNLLTSDEGLVKIADFGLAGRLEMVDEGGPARLVEGTPRYVAPELCLGHPPSLASDIYALGMTWYALLAGSAAFGGKDSQEIFRKHLRAPVPDIRQIRSDVPPAHVALIAQCLAKLPEDRFESARHFLSALDAVLDTGSGADETARAAGEAASLRDLILASKAAAIRVEDSAAAEARAAAAAEDALRPPSAVVPVAALLVVLTLLIVAIVLFWRIFRPH
jgi:eukaryotic-like serine/threonine-protein kinase